MNNIQFRPIEIRNGKHCVDLPVASNVIEVKLYPLRGLGLLALCDINSVDRPYELYILKENQEVPKDARHLGNYLNTAGDTHAVFAKHFQLKL